MDSVGMAEVFVSAGPPRSQQSWPLVPDRWRASLMVLLTGAARLATRQPRPHLCLRFHVHHRHHHRHRWSRLQGALPRSRACPLRCSFTSWAFSTSMTYSPRLGYDCSPSSVPQVPLANHLTLVRRPVISYGASRSRHFSMSIASSAREFCCRPSSGPPRDPLSPTLLLALSS